MLAHFSLLDIFFSLLDASCAFGGRFFLMFDLFFRVSGGSGSDFRAFWDNFENPKLLFWCFVVRACQQCGKMAHVQKPQFFPCFCMVFTYCELCLQVTQQRKIIPGACSTELPAKIVLPFRLEMDSGGVWRSLGRHLTGFCSLLGGFWPLLGTSWASALDIPPLKQLK